MTTQPFFLTTIVTIAISMVTHQLAAQQPASMASSTLKVGAFEFKLAAPWTDKGTTRPMVKAIATWTPPEGSSHSPIDAAFYHFGQGQGGSTQANIERWKGQFQQEPVAQVEDFEISNHKVSLVFLTGTYLDGPMFGKKTPRENYGLVGAILESDAGAVFIKATAPEDAAEACRESFRSLALSPFQE